MFSIDRELYNHHHCLILEYFHPKGNPLAVSSHSRVPSPESLGTINLLSVSTDLSTLDILCKWDHTTCGSFLLASFTQQTIQVHPHGSTCQNFICFYHWKKFHATDILALFTCWWTAGFFHFGDVMNVVQSLSCVWLLANPMDCSTPAFTISQSLLRFMSIELGMPSNHLVSWITL